MRPSDTDKPPYVARVEKLEADHRNNVKVRVRWYYRPEESIGGRRQFHGAKELFLSDHFDVQSAHTIEGKCTVHSFKNYTKLENVGAEDYFCRFEYKAATGAFTPDRVAVWVSVCGLVFDFSVIYHLAHWCFLSFTVVLCLGIASVRCRIIRMIWWCSVRDARIGNFAAFVCGLIYWLLNLLNCQNVTYLPLSIQLIMWKLQVGTSQDISLNDDLLIRWVYVLEFCFWVVWVKLDMLYDYGHFIYWIYTN